MSVLCAKGLGEFSLVPSASSFRQQLPPENPGDSRAQNGRMDVSTLESSGMSTATFVRPLQLHRSQYGCRDVRERTQGFGAPLPRCFTLSSLSLNRAGEIRGRESAAQESVRLVGVESEDRGSGCNLHRLGTCGRRGRGRAPMPRQESKFIDSGKNALERVGSQGPGRQKMLRT